MNTKSINKACDIINKIANILNIKIKLNKLIKKYPDVAASSDDYIKIFSDEKGNAVKAKISFKLMVTMYKAISVFMEISKEEVLYIVGYEEDTYINDSYDCNFDVIEKFSVALNDTNYNDIICLFNDFKDVEERRIINFINKQKIITKELEDTLRTVNPVAGLMYDYQINLKKYLDKNTALCKALRYAIKGKDEGNLNKYVSINGNNIYVYTQKTSTDVVRGVRITKITSNIIFTANDTSLSTLLPSGEYKLTLDKLIPINNVSPLKNEIIPAVSNFIVKETANGKGYVFYSVKIPELEQEMLKCQENGYIIAYDNGDIEFCSDNDEVINISDAELLLLKKRLFA